AVARRLLAMAPIRSEIERGASPRSAMERAGRALFWKERDAVARDIVRWPADKIATALDRLAAAERLLKTSNGPGSIAADAELFTLARAARR
ncbi:MAG TPA: DNA polymerase III subunit delta, partial [Sphingomonas sp.]|nr:DNA polymerase III subunit delta [Sphingomonas sp.]